MNLRDVTVKKIPEAREDGEFVNEVLLDGERIGYVRQVGKQNAVSGFEAYSLRQQIIGLPVTTQRQALQAVKREHLKYKAQQQDVVLDADAIAELPEYEP